MAQAETYSIKVAVGRLELSLVGRRTVSASGVVQIRIHDASVAATTSHFTLDERQKRLVNRDFGVVSRECGLCLSVVLTGGEVRAGEHLRLCIVDGNARFDLPSNSIIPVVPGRRD